MTCHKVVKTIDVKWEGKGTTSRGCNGGYETMVITVPYLKKHEYTVKEIPYIWVVLCYDPVSDRRKEEGDAR